jgi:Flp pilus assembly protein TadG
MKKLFLTRVLFVCAASITNAQELRCRVNMQYNDIANADKDLFNTLRNSIEDFMNAQSWTNHTYEEQEKIDLKLTMRITSQSSKNFSGTLQVQSSRPVYNSTYTTTLFNHVDDKIAFQYEENEPIEFSENSFVSNLSSILAY